MAGATGPHGGGFRSATGTDPRTGLRALVERVHKARERALPAVAIALVRQIKIELSQPGHGRVYLRGATNVGFNASGALIFTKGKRAGQFAPKHGPGRHVASAPGEPPAIDTNNLRGSITWEWVGGSAVITPSTGAVTGHRGGTGVRVGTNVVYAPWLEFGVPPHLAPRPFMRPAVEKLRPTIHTILRFAYNGVVGEIGTSYTPPEGSDSGGEAAD